MHLEVTIDGGNLRVVLEGRLDLTGVNAISNQFAFQVAGHDGPAVVDCRKVSFMGSLGMGMLVAAAKALRRKGHSLTLLEPQPLVEEVLRTAGIHNVVPIVHDEDEQRDGRE